MNLIVLTQQDFVTKDRVILDDERFLQIRNIHQSKVGDCVRIGELNGLIGTGIIEQINDTSITLQTTFTQQPPEKLPITIILALPRPKMVRRIFRSITELGVRDLIIINSYKVEKSYWSSPAIDEGKIQHYLLAGLQQSKDTVLPNVSFKRLFKPFVEDELPAIAFGTKAIIAHPGVKTPCPHTLNCPITLAIGPEGGFTNYEVSKFIDAGFEATHLGQRLLRVENALTVLVSKLYT